MTGKVDPIKQQKVVNYVKSKQRGDGSWSTYYGGPGDLSVTVQAYFALKLAGISAQEPFMQRARDFVLSHGGITKSNTLTKIWLALFGQLDWRGTPSMPPDIILLPNWFYFNIYEFASWSRATIVALMVVLTNKPVCRIPKFAQVSELYVEPENDRHYSLSKFDKIFSWRSFFLLLERFFKAWERLPFKPGRGLALQKAEKWIVDHQEADGSWGGIMLPWVYSLMALKCLGYTLEHPVIARGLKGLESFIVEDRSTLRLQPATSPVWDTAWAMIALSESGLSANHPALVKADTKLRWGWRQMNTGSAEERLSRIPPSQRILLLPHCLRPSQTCSGKYNKQGLQCSEDCTEDCTTGRLRRAALGLGYKGVCITPGGRLAVNYVKDTHPEAIVAVACQKELEEGLHAVQHLAAVTNPRQ